MRERKWRAWDKVEKRMVYCDWRSFRNWYDQPKGGRVVCERGSCMARLNFSDPMDFTGLHDKNGKEIFEGDILRWWREIMLIEWSNEQGGWEMLTKSRLGHHNFHVGFCEEVEIIGDAYQNPDLLDSENHHK